MNPTRLAFVDVIAAHAEQVPHAVAVIDEHGEVGYAELWAAAGAVAGGLHRCGVGRGERVVTAMTPGAAHIAVLLGIMAAGAVAAPLNTRLTPVEAGDFLATIAPRLVVHDAVHAALARTLDVATVALAGSGALAERLSPLAVPPPAVPPPAVPPGGGDEEPMIDGVDPEAPAAIFGTGGTTGRPKGAAWSHRGLWLYTASCQANMEIRRTDVELYFSPFFHVALVTVLFSTLYAGGCVWVLPRFDEREVIDALRTGRPTRLFGAPTALVRLIRHPDFAPAATGQLRRVLFGSTRSEPGFATELAGAFPHARLVTGYGATEFGAVTRLRSWELHDGTDHGVGRPVPGVTVRVVDEHGVDLARGGIGQLVVHAPWQMLGYWATTPDDPTGRSRGGLLSGDRGRFDEDGFLHLVGRTKDMIITGGENVFPVEVENVVAAFPGVAAVAVFGQPHELWGEQVEAAVVCAGEVDVDALRAFCRTRLAGYKVPRRVHLVPELPVTAAMKVDKRRLREALRGT